MSLWNLAEYVKSSIRPELRPAERMPWKLRLGPGLYLLKDDSFLRLLGFRGKDPSDMTQESLWRTHEKLNAALRSMDGSWAAWIEARNVTADTPADLAATLAACQNDAAYLLTGQQIAPFASGNRRELQQVGVGAQIVDAGRSTRKVQIFIRFRRRGAKPACRGASSG